MRSTPILGERPYGKRDGRVLLVTFFDPNGISTIVESIHAWQRYSRREVIVVNLWPNSGGSLKLPASLTLGDYDAVVVHPTVSYLAENIASLDCNLKLGFAEYDGVKILMKQDEQVATSQFVNIVGEKKFDLIFTCLPPEQQKKVYRRDVIGDCDLIQVLTGYVSPTMRQGYKPSRRDIDISYRGSIQPLEFGRLGYEKRGIGYDVSRVLGDQEVRLDISSRWEDRMLGEEWGRFLSRSRTVLGTESGSNLFDFEGVVARWCRSYEAAHSGEDATSERYYRAAHDAYLHDFEDNVNYAQISPRHFEAAAAGAAQILYEGSYSGIFHANEHFKPLRRDLGNISEIVDFIRDEASRVRMVERAFEEVILDRRNWYESFVTEADAAIERRRDAKGKLSNPSRRVLGCSDSTQRPVAHILVPHNPVTDPRISWVASSLSKSHDVYVIGAYDFSAIDDTPTYERNDEGITIVRIERTKHNAAWLPSSAQLRTAPSTPRALLAALAGFAALPEGILADRIGAHGTTSLEIAKFRSLCAYFVNTNSALIEAAQNIGRADLVVAVDLETLPAATAIAGEDGSFCIFDAHEYWPHSFPDFRYWQIEFWLGIERQLSQLADIRITVSPQLTTLMAEEYGCEFLFLPNCATLEEGEGLDLEKAFAQRGVSGPGPLEFLFLGGFAEGRGLEETLRAFTLVKSDARLALQGPDGPYRRHLIELARSLGLSEDRVSFPPAVSESELIRRASRADVGLIPYDPIYFAHRYCCPNKLSQYLAAGLPILCSRTEYVSGIVTREMIGHAVDIGDPEAYAASIDRLSARRSELVDMGRRARRFFQERYHWEAFISPILSRIKDDLKDRARISSGMDLDWIAKASMRHQRHGAAFLPPRTMFGEAMPPDDGTVKWLRKLWRLIPPVPRNALAAWLRKWL